MLSNPDIGPCKIGKSSREVETRTLNKLAIKNKSKSEQKASDVEALGIESQVNREL